MPDQPKNAATTRERVLHTDSRLEALARLSEGLGAPGTFVLITGGAGAGKTHLVREALRRWGSRAQVADLAGGPWAPHELVEEIVRRFGLEAPGLATRPQLLSCLERLAAGAQDAGRVPVIVVDDAHELPRELLEELRLLSQTLEQAGRPLKVVLVGLPAFAARLSDPELAPIRERVGLHCHVTPLTLHETRRYLNEVVAEPGPGAVLFSRKASRAVFERTDGVPGAIEALAAGALHRARAAGAANVSPEHVRAAAAGSATAAVTRPEAPAPEPEPLEESPAASGPSNAGKEAAPPPPPVAREHVPASEVPSPAPSVTDIPPATAAVSLPEAAHDDDPRVQDWVGRFIRPEEPRFGALFTSRTGHAGADTSPLFDPSPPPDEPAPGADPPPPVVHGVRAPRPERRRRPDRASLGWVRPRPRPGSWLAPAAVTVAVLSVVALLVVLPLRHRAAGGGALQAAAGGPAPIRNEAPAPASPPAASQAPIPPALPESTATRPPTSTAPTPPPTDPATQAAPIPAAPTAPSGDLYVLDVGSYLYAGAAEHERDRLVEQTGLHGWVYTVGRGDTSTYHVVLGVYRGRDRAGIGASLLLARDLVGEARIVPLPPRRQRF